MSDDYGFPQRRNKKKFKKKEKKKHPYKIGGKERTRESVLSHKICNNLRISRV
jgi:hypothetical protein